MSVVEQGLRRVIGVDGEPDRRLDALDDDALLALHRSLVLLRTYDERSVVYHSQGRIGTYAIFRGHEAIQAGLVHALERARLDLPQLPRLGDRPPPRPPGRDHPAVVARPPVGVVEPGGRERRLHLRPDRHAGPSRRGSRLGSSAQGVGRGGRRPLRRRGDLRGRVPRRGQPGRGRTRAARPRLQQQPVGDLDAPQRADRSRAPRGQGDRVRDAWDPRGRARRPRRFRGRARRGREGPCG